MKKYKIKIFHEQCITALEDKVNSWLSITEIEWIEVKFFSLKYTTYPADRTINYITLFIYK
jgi:hypothetical protein